MATYSASVRKQGPVSKEHCSADPEKLKTVGRARGLQVRIKRSSSEYALYTVSETQQESPDRIVRMSDAGLLRLGTSTGFTGTLDSQVPHSTLTDAGAEANSEFVERLTDNGTHKGLIAIAPHGGNIEQYTDKQAERIAAQLTAKGVSSWRCKGWRQGGGAYARWHVTSTDIHEASFPRLRKVISRGFTYAVAFHGFEDPALDDILIGGGATAQLKHDIESAIKGVVGSDFTVHVFEQSDPLGGSSQRNVVNRLTANKTNGIHIEQKRGPREQYGQAIADAVASVYKSKLP
jgi:phage replication-related protein YjqB (UPF0714/DUF867 family)